MNRTTLFISFVSLFTPIGAFPLVLLTQLMGICRGGLGSGVDCDLGFAGEYFASVTVYTELYGMFLAALMSKLFLPGFVSFALVVFIMLLPAVLVVATLFRRVRILFGPRPE